MDSHDKEPMILTSPGRISRGIIIVGITLAIGAAITVTFFDEMFANPPPVTQIRVPPPPSEEPLPGGPTVISILSGAAVQGNPDYNPDEARVPLGNDIVWDNLDTVPHTATSGTGTDDPNSGDIFDTGIINGGEKSANIKLENVNVGDVIDYYCFVHPYMTSRLTIAPAEELGTPPAGGAPSGPTINILAGSSVQGSPDYDPDQLTVKKGDKITVVNKDNILHTVTNGESSADPNSAKLFDSKFLDAGETATIDTLNLDPAEYDYYCQVHPYMKGKLIVE